jgi:predicted component of type VI protein secretion system
MVLPDPERTISRVHAKVVFRNGTYAVEDRGSNPILVNGNVVGHGKEWPLAPGDVLQIGGYELGVRASGSPAVSDDPFAVVFAAGGAKVMAPAPAPAFAAPPPPVTAARTPRRHRPAPWASPQTGIRWPKRPSPADRQRQPPVAMKEMRAACSARAALRSPSTTCSGWATRRPNPECAGQRTMISSGGVRPRQPVCGRCW